MEARAILAKVPSSKEVHANLEDLSKLAESAKGKYERLTTWMASLSPRAPTITVSFHELEKVLGGELPPSAWQHRSWWANDSTSHSQSIAWLEAGWRVQKVDFSSESVVFHRKHARESAA
jgi:hypothetical protein